MSVSGRFKKLTLLCAPLLVLVAATACASSSGGGTPSGGGESTNGSGASKSTYVLGAVDQLSGAVPELAPGEEESAINAWTGWVNAHGGINGHPVKVIVMDDKGIATVGAAAATTLIQDDHVLGIVSLFSAGIPSMVDVVHSNNVAVIMGEPIWDQAVMDPNFFPTSGTVDNLNIGYVTLAKQLGRKKLAWIAGNTSAASQIGTNAARAAATKAGLGFFTTALPNSVPNYTSTCIQMQQAHADVAWAVFLPRIGDDCAAQNYTPIWETTLVGSIANTVNPVLESTAKYKVYSLQWAFPWFLDVPQLQDFHSAIKQYGGSEPVGPTTAETWQMLEVAQYALSKLSGSPTSAEFLNALYTINNLSVGGVTPPLIFTKGKNKEVQCFYEVLMADQKLSAPRDITPVCANQS
jgi:branched-chain amino acid transport system substrate-binding protein